MFSYLAGAGWWCFGLGTCPWLSSQLLPVVPIVLKLDSIVLSPGPLFLLVFCWFFILLGPNINVTKTQFLFCSHIEFISLLKTSDLALYSLMESSKLCTRSLPN